MKSNAKLHLGFFTFLLFLITYLSRNNFLFWDTVQLAGKQALFFYKNDFSKFLLPDEIDSGHIPFFGFYVSTVWSIFGKSLPVSHFAMLPFQLAIAYYFYHFLNYFMKDLWTSFLITCLIIVEPTLLAQMTLVSPDVALVAFMAMSLYGIVYQDKYLTAIGFILLNLISMRGTMVFLALMIFYFYFNRDKEKFTTIKEILKVSIPAIIVFIICHGYHYIHKGWVFYHRDSPWAPSFEKVNLSGIIKNLAIVMWRLIDFGRVILFILLFILLRKHYKKIYESHDLRNLFVLCILMLFFLSVGIITYKGLTGHRYLLPVYIVLLIYILINAVKLDRYRFGYYWIIILMFFVGGHFIFYPGKIDQGWDSSLGHIGVYNCFNNFLAYIEEQKIPVESIGTSFPFKSKISEMYLNESEYYMKDWNEEGNKYILYSNVCNEMKNHISLEGLREQKRFEKYGIQMILYIKGD